MQEQREEAQIPQTWQTLRCPTCADRLVEVAAQISHPQTGKIVLSIAVIAASAFGTSKASPAAL